MKSDSVPYLKTVFVCTHSRPDSEGRVSCGDPGRGGVELCAALKEGVKTHGLTGKVRVARTGCLDLCEQGPNVFIYPDDAWLSDAKPADAEQILRRLKK